jgi:hypothetical protein
MKAIIRLEKVKVRRRPDNDPDLSYLGEYSRTPGKGAIDRVARGDCGKGELPYFTPCMTGEETGNPASPEQDYQRMEAYNRGAWCMVGLQAEATISIDLGGIKTLQTVRSGGLWGIESDSDAGHFASVAADELTDLREQLESLGVDMSNWDAIDKAIDND